MRWLRDQQPRRKRCGKARGEARPGKACWALRQTARSTGAEEKPEYRSGLSYPSR